MHAYWQFRERRHAAAARAEQVASLYTFTSPQILPCILPFVNVTTLASIYLSCKEAKDVCDQNTQIWKDVAHNSWTRSKCHAEIYDGDWKKMCLSNNKRNEDTLWACEECNFAIGGLCCAGKNRGKATAVSGPVCDSTLVFLPDGSFGCPAGHGTIGSPTCNAGHMMIPSPCPVIISDSFRPMFDQQYYAAGYEPTSPHMAKERKGDEITRFYNSNFVGCPVFSCKECSFGVYGIVCLSSQKCIEQEEGSLLRREGFYERVWCSYVWTCSSRECASRKGTIQRILKCLCLPAAARNKDDDDGFMDFSEFNSTWGVASNY
eukprot:TRINITY_DN6622_c0_g2_i1.p1 TRINITY_DN6622_c0_g2~~TRINITY_DN6622_c0_g2_i1.p1  ORF type:complete len:319 (-),score=23.14 TRINITY_DN6622_c0_g2_i1:26-982(-)